MINPKIEQAMNQQVKHEMYSAYLYLAMAAYFHSKNLDGMAKWMRCQAQEEMTHARRFFDHVIERGGRVVLEALEKPKSEWASPLEAWRDAYKHEQFITSKIYEIANLARELGDHASNNLLNWFHEEQIEEEEQTLRAVQTLEMTGESGPALVMYDRELGKREFKEGNVF